MSVKPEQISQEVRNRWALEERAKVLISKLYGSLTIFTRIEAMRLMVSMAQIEAAPPQPSAPPDRCPKCNLTISRCDCRPSASAEPSEPTFAKLQKRVAEMEAEDVGQEREEAERAYTFQAFDYERDPVGSRDWELFWKGWLAGRAALRASGKEGV